MFKFNPDGSIKLPEQFERQKEENKQKFLSKRCMKVRKEIVNFTAPKKCLLRITLPEAVTDNRFIETIYYQHHRAVPTKINKVNEKEFEVEIGTDFRRCTDCSSLINQYREFLEIIVDKGSCTFEPRNLSYEDHFE